MATDYTDIQFLSAFFSIERLKAKKNPQPYGYFILTLLFCLCTGTAALADEAIPVRTLPLSQLAIYPESSAPAAVVSLNDSSIASQIEASVSTVPVRIGDQVKTGAILVQLDCQRFKLDRAQLQGEKQAIQAKLKLSEWQLQQAQTLAEQQSLPLQQVQERESQRAVLRGNLAAHNARLKLTEQKIANCVIKAPYPGVIMDRQIAVGQYATRGQSLVRLLDVSKPEVSAQVPSRDARALSLASKLTFEHDGQRYPLKLRTLLPVIHTKTATQEVRLDFVDRYDVPGAAGRLLWRDKIMHLPVQYLVKRNQQLGVFINQAGIAHFHPLPNAQNGRPVAINLPFDTSIVVTGQFALHQGSAINAQVQTTVDRQNTDRSSAKKFR